jgi:hypothetical protein
VVIHYFNVVHYPDILPGGGGGVENNENSHSKELVPCLESNPVSSGINLSE